MLYGILFVHESQTTERQESQKSTDQMIEQKRVVSDFQPSLFVENPNAESKYKSIYGVPCIRKKFNSVAEARKLQKDSSFKMSGQDDYALQYISDTYPGTVNLAKYAKSVRVANIDIEVPAPEFPSPNDAKRF